MALELEQLLEQVFSGQPEPSEPSANFQERILPENILHSAPHAGKYYGSFQQLTRQFVDGESHGNVVQFSTSKLDHLLREKVNAWNNSSEHEPRPASASRDMDLLAPTTVQGGAGSLFSWSTSDTSIAARKRQLQQRSATSLSLEGKNSSSLDTRPTLPLPANRVTKPSVMQRLNRIVEKESNKFIQDRIEVIKAHHRKEASKKVDERKRRDHEMRLQRIKQKEEEYEQSLKNAIAMQSNHRQSGFFGSLFGMLKLNSSSFVLDTLDPDPPSYPAPVTTSSSSEDIKVATPTKAKRMSFFPASLFGSTKKNSLPASPRTPTRAGNSFDNLSIRSAVSSDVEASPSGIKGDFLAFEGLDEMLDSVENGQSPNKHNQLNDILSSPSKQPETDHQFIAFKPSAAPGSNGHHLTNDTEDLLSL